MSTTVWDRLDTNLTRTTNPKDLPPKERLTELTKRAKASLEEALRVGNLNPSIRRDDLNKLVAFGFFDEIRWAVTEEGYAAFGKEKPDNRSVSEKIRDGVYNTKLPFPKMEDYPLRSKDPEYKKARDEYSKDMSRLHHEVFKLDLFKEEGVVGNPKADKCFSIAWDRGHGYGLQDVEAYFSEIVELIK